MDATLIKKRSQGAQSYHFNLCYELPSYVFLCLELKKLKLKNCFFKPPLNFEGFLNLKDLFLRRNDFGANLCGAKINLPQHKQLSLHKCTNVYNFNIKLTKLQNLTVIACPDAMLTTMLREPRVDVGPASNYLESPNLDCTLDRLQTVEIRYLEGSKPELLFIKLLLAHSPSLQKFNLRPSEASDVQKRLDIAVDIMQFPQPSTKAKMFYLNPNLQHADFSIANGNGLCCLHVYLAYRNKRTVVSCGEEDNLSNLPEHLIDSIIERLPIEDVVRTSIISKKWRYRWTTMRVLVFDKNFSNKFASNGDFGRNSLQAIGQWMSFLSRNGVTELVLTYSNQHYELPSYVFSCLDLTKLELRNCIYKPPLEFNGFLNLKELNLEDVDFGTSCGNKINLPKLKKLFLFSCKNVYKFNIKATKLRKLTVIACPDALLLGLLDSPCLISVFISSQDYTQDFVGVEKMNLATMLSNLPRLRYIYTDSKLNLTFISQSLVVEKIPKLLPHAISRLKHMWLIRFQVDDLDQLDVALCLLRNSPKLEKLTVTHLMEHHIDVGPASNRLESPNCLDCTLDQLQVVEMRHLRGSKPELLFIKLLLAHSPSLNKFTITPNGDLDAKKIHDIAKDVMQFPRASTKAKLFYLDP
ncbi:F-box/FBD/LRR-repeat protein At1g13570 [Lactuca sativa]|uniref:F-box/FBD/LRR-repeat protein At1g13570 n=1 Tax=Lactuca sativa TaxID=4236 RepID=UPI001C690876|nr:F-box/FBD/LRR-repeat protein At1g13570 [Lactuca sativa]